MSMGFELMLLVALIVIFIVSFCGLLHKIRKTYENDRILTERAIASGNRDSNLSLSEVYVNPSFLPEVDHNAPDAINTSVFPCAPPPYTEYYCDPPPKYEDLLKNDALRSSTEESSS